jgi:uncharacterized protein (TIGR02284 family)
MTSTTSSQLFNDLVSTHRDRIAEYEKATLILKPQEAGLSITFSEIIKESEQCIAEISNRLSALTDMDPASSAAVTDGKIYAIWLASKTNPAAHPSYSLLDSCERNEDALLKVYATVLNQKDLFTPDDLVLLNTQQYTLQQTHDLIRDKRNAYRELVNNNQII